MGGYYVIFVGWKGEYEGRDKGEVEAHLLAGKSQTVVHLCPDQTSPKMARPGLPLQFHFNICSIT